MRPRQFPDAAEAQRLVAAAAARFQEAQAAALPAPQLRLIASHLEGAMAQLFLATGGIGEILGAPPESAVIQVLRCGAAEILAVPGEVFSSAGAAMRAARPRPSLLAGYANDYLGYLVPPAAVAAGGYEALTALIEPESAQAIAAAFCRSPLL